jgi:type 1 glutamine amidotransferase
MFKRLCFLFAVVAVVLAAGAAQPKHIVFMIGEDEYKTWETLPEFVAKDLKPRGYRITIIQANEADKNNFPGLTAALTDADLLFLSVRRRTPLKEQLDAVRAHLAAGKPLVGIRTACHAFALRPKDKLADAEKLAAWQEFDPEVLGGHYTNHYGNGPKTAVAIAPGAEASPILKGITISALNGNGSLYKVSPLVTDATPLLLGTIPDKPAEPLAWTRLYGAKHARIFNTTLGHPDDFQSAEFRRLLVNAVAWAVGK